MRRKIEEYLLHWKNEKGHNPLIIKGCRQSGKTYTVLKFVKEHYKHCIYINFFENPDYLTIFENSLKVEDLTMYISAMLGKDAIFEPYNTCLILDELQECPNARTALKFFKLDGRYDVICTGSLLGISGYKNDIRSVPVGYETIVDMYPMDFKEFLWANDINDDIISHLKDCLENIQVIPAPLHNRLRDLLLSYVVVGGMPAVVKEFVSSKQINKVLQLQKDIVNGYRDDMVKYADKYDKAKIRDCFNSIPMQLSKENKKFQYALVKKNMKAVNALGSLQWLEDSGIVRRCYNLNIIELPLKGNAIENIFKLYMIDIGLFVSMLEEGTQIELLQGKLHSYKGAIFENLLADFFSKNNKSIYYFRKDSGLEIDFVIRSNSEIQLIECKSNTGNAKSLKTILKYPDKYKVSKAIKLGDYNIGMQGNILTLPLYMGFLL